MAGKRLAAVAAVGIACALSWGGAPFAPGAAQARAGVAQIGGTWDAVWLNSRGERRKGLIVVDQRGAQISARIVDRGNVTATGTLAGASFTLRGYRTGIPFTITGRVQGRKMAGTLSAILTERTFTATRRKGR